MKDLKKKVQSFFSTAKKKKTVTEVTLTIDDLKQIENYLITECELDTLDIIELVVFIEKTKGILLDI